MFGEQVTRLRRTQVGTDPAKRPVYQWTDAELVGAAFDPGGSVEPPEVGRAQVVTTPRLYFTDPRVDVAAGDRMRVRGDEYAVVGDPAVWVDPWGSDVGGVTVELQRSTEEG